MPISSEFINPQKSLAQYVYNKMPTTFFPRGPAQLAGPTGILYLIITDFFLFLLIILTKILKKIDFQNFQKFSFFVIFFASGWRSKSQFLPRLQPIDIKILPASIFFKTSYPRKYNKIEIWTYEPSSNFDFKSLALPICRRPRFSKFPWHRITLRVGMMPSCSTSY